MPTFTDLREFYDPALTLPVDGVEYRIEAPAPKDGLRLRRLMMDPEVASKKSDLDYLCGVFALLGAEYDAEADAFSGVEGSVFARMEAAGLPWPTVFRAAETAGLFYSYGEAQALSFWSRELLASANEAAAAAAALMEAEQAKSATEPVKKAPARKGRK